MLLHHAGCPGFVGAGGSRDIPLHANQKTIKAAVKSLRRGSLAPAPQILIHPMEQIEGGVTQVEYRVFVELALGAGAAKAGVHVRPILSGDAIKLAIREYNNGKR